MSRENLPPQKTITTALVLTQTLKCKKASACHRLFFPSHQSERCVLLKVDYARIRVTCSTTGTGTVVKFIWAYSFMPVAIGFTGQNGMQPNESYFDRSVQLS